MFDGFILPENGTGYDVTMPANWPEVSKAIDNLAELKVVQLVLWVTWGNGQADALMPLTLDDFAEVTGLSIQSVRSGIDKAIEHGYIERQEQGGNRYYGIKLFEVQDLVVSEVGTSSEVVLDADSCEVQEFDTSSNSSKDINITNNGNIIRIQDGNNSRPCKGLTRADNATLCNRVESLSRALGDHEHIASNVGQARHILAGYQASGGNFEAFLLLMYEARDLARRKTKMRRKNRMPYFFVCLRNMTALQQQVA